MFRVHHHIMRISFFLLFDVIWHFSKKMFFSTMFTFHFILTCFHEMFILMTIVILFYDDYFHDLHAFFYSYSSIKFLQISLLIISAFSIFKQNVGLSLFHFITDFDHDILIIFNFEWAFSFFFSMRWVCFVFVVTSFIIIFITHMT